MDFNQEMMMRQATQSGAGAQNRDLLSRLIGLKLETNGMFGDSPGLFSGNMPSVFGGVRGAKAEGWLNQMHTELKQMSDQHHQSTVTAGANESHASIKAAQIEAAGQAFMNAGMQFMGGGGMDTGAGHGSGLVGAGVGGSHER